MCAFQCPWYLYWLTLNFYVDIKNNDEFLILYWLKLNVWIISNFLPLYITLKIKHILEHQVVQHVLDED